jgi:hypothetical protein
MLPVLLKHASASDRRTLANAMHELLVTDLRPELPLITAPLTVLYVIPPAAPITAEEYARAVPELYGNARGARLELIEESSHYIQLDQPARFVAEVDKVMGAQAAEVRPVMDDSTAVAAALSYMRGQVNAPEAVRGAQLVLVGAEGVESTSPTRRHVVRWTSPSIVTVYGHDGSDDEAQYATTLLLNGRSEVCSVSIHLPGNGRAPEITPKFLDEAIAVSKGLDPFFSWFADRWVFRDLTWHFETSNREALVEFGRGAAPDGLVGQRADTVLRLGGDGVVIEGHVATEGGRQTPFLVILRFDAAGHIAERTDHYDLTGMTFPTLEKAGLAAFIQGMRCK